MKIISLIILGIVFVTTLCFAQEQNVYSNTEGHFSFIVPNGWEEYSQSDMDGWNNRASQVSGKNVKYVAGFHKTIGESPHSNMTIQIDANGKMSENEIQQFMTSQGQQEIAHKIAQGYVKNIPLDFDKLTYNKERNILFQKTKMTIGDKKKIVVTATLMSNYGFVTLSFASTEENFDIDFNDFNKIIDSFKFEEGYKY